MPAWLYGERIQLFTHEHKNNIHTKFSSVFPINYRYYQLEKSIKLYNTIHGQVILATIRTYNSSLITTVNNSSPVHLEATVFVFSVTIIWKSSALP